MRDDRGAASLEYAGSLFVVVLLVASLIAGATPIGGAIKTAICRALSISCGTDAAAQRAKDLGIKCIVSKADDKMSINASVEIRAERTDKGGVTDYGDNSGQVVLSQGAGIGDDESTEIGDFAAAKFKITGNGDVGFVYKFPPEYGGSKAADAFLGDRRDLTHTAAEILLPPGTQALEEGAHRVANGVSNAWDNWVAGPLGFGPDDDEKAAQQRAQAAGTADAIQVSVSIQGEAGVDAGAGVKRKTNNADGTTSENELQAPVSASVTAKGELNGTITVPTHSGGPDAVPASFKGEISGDITGNINLGGVGPLPPFFNASGVVGGKGSYTVTFDKDGNPSTLTITTETQLGYGTSLQPKVYNSGAKGKAGVKDNGITVTTQVLDLNPATPQGAANKAAFDHAFDVVGTSVNGITAKIATPAAMRTIPGQVDPIRLATDWVALQQRLSADAFTTTSTYSESTTEYGGDLKVAGVGLGGTYSNTTRQIQSATLHDNRYGVDVQLATCPS